MAHHEVVFVAPSPLGGAQCNVYASDKFAPGADIGRAYRIWPQYFRQIGLMRADYRAARLMLVFLERSYPREDVECLGAGESLWLERETS